MQCIDEGRSDAFAVAQQLCKAAGVDISTNPAAQPTTTATATHNAAATSSVVGKGMMIGGFVAAAGVLAL
ncbi:hypothetical protein FRC04_005778 [Tulasnella sp. 424]|nr:hypothetical protein FRC04_005778 [Tulasnella sp. 424]KAG8961905.1 hypothetical protein FRC05_005657 [Tulasnella sp. 425]